MAEARVRALMALARAKAAAATDQRNRSDVLAVLAAWFGSKAAIGAAQLPGAILDELVEDGFNRRAADEAGRIVLKHPLSGRSGNGSPSPQTGASTARMVAAQEPQVRAEYLMAAADRLSEADDFDAAVANEERYAAQHVAAGQNRRKAAKALDDAAKDSHILRWITLIDKNTTPECAALNGRLFTINNPPGIPGAMHAACRCRAEPYSGSHGLALALGGG